MQTKNKLKNINWHEKRMLSNCVLVPKSTGVYVIGKINYKSGLEISREYLYVGISNNLHRRLKEHGPEEEVNLPLRKYVERYIENIKCWYCTIEKSFIRKTEKELIKQLNPKFNIQHNK